MSLSAVWGGQIFGRPLQPSERLREALPPPPSDELRLDEELRLELLLELEREPPLLEALELRLEGRLLARGLCDRLEDGLS